MVSAVMVLAAPGGKIPKVGLSTSSNQTLKTCKFDRGAYTLQPDHHKLTSSLKSSWTLQSMQSFKAVHVKGLHLPVLRCGCRAQQTHCCMLARGEQWRQWPTSIK